MSGASRLYRNARVNLVTYLSFRRLTTTLRSHEFPNLKFEAGMLWLLNALLPRFSRTSIPYSQLRRRGRAPQRASVSPISPNRPVAAVLPEEKTVAFRFYPAQAGTSRDIAEAVTRTGVP
jgi:hypothetical protein